MMNLVNMFAKSITELTTLIIGVFLEYTLLFRRERGCLEWWDYE